MLIFTITAWKECEIRENGVGCHFTNFHLKKLALSLKNKLTTCPITL